jgi:hypothetical protein
MGPDREQALLDFAHAHAGETALTDLPGLTAAEAELTWEI